MATKTSQRAFIWVIAIVMVVGTLAGFIAMILQPKNDQADQDRINELTAQYQKDYEAYQVKADAQAATLSEKYYPIFSPYRKHAAAFDATAVTELKTKDLVVGDGAEIKKDSTYSAYFIGWNPKGKMFEGGSSFTDDALSAPAKVEGNTGMIEGWIQGVVGMKTNGIREITIPSKLAYDDQEKSEDIPANTPLKFIVFIIPTPDEIEQPEIPAELLRYYQAGAQ